MRQYLWLTIIFNLLFVSIASAEPVKILDWQGIRVVYLSNNQLPNYNISIYFSDGAMSDDAARIGETELMFGQLTNGTNRYNQAQIAEALDYYGTSVSSNVVHEYSNINITGLVKDVVPNLKMVCHLFRNTTFPKALLDKDKKRMISFLSNLNSNHGKLADRAFRQLSMAGTQVAHPSGGYLQTIPRISSSHLKAKLDYYNNKVSKTIYLSGPSEILDVQHVIEKDCAWTNHTANFKRVDHIVDKGSFTTKRKIYLIPVKKANQAQIRIGRYLSSEFKQIPEHVMSLSSSYLGGGFTSLLMQEIRVKRGLTYGIGSFASMQGHYGRSGISSSTRNEKVVEMIEVIDEILSKVSNVKNIDKEMFDRNKRYLKGSFLFGFERNQSYLNQLLFYDHIGVDFSYLNKFPYLLNTVTEEQVAQTLGQLFKAEEQIIVVVGDEKLKTDLKKFGDVKLLNMNQVL
jgi:zinc protease